MTFEPSMSIDVMDVVRSEAPTDKADITSLSLDELAAEATREHNLVSGAVDRAEAALSEGLVHAIRVGHVLIRARDLIQGEGKSWRAWKRSNLPFSEYTASNYIRYATYEDHLIAHEVPLTTATALEALHGLPAVGMGRGRKRLHDDSEYKRLHDEGLTKAQIAEVMGVSWNTVRNALDPDARKKKADAMIEARKRQRAAEKALAEQQERKERDRLAKSGGGELAKSYSEVRKCLASLDAAVADASPEQRTCLREAIRCAHSAEDQIVKALRLGRTDG